MRKAKAVIADDASGRKESIETAEIVGPTRAMNSVLIWRKEGSLDRDP